MPHALYSLSKEVGIDAFSLGCDEGGLISSIKAYQIKAGAITDHHPYGSTRNTNSMALVNILAKFKKGKSHLLEQV